MLGFRESVVLLEAGDGVKSLARFHHFLSSCHFLVISSCLVPPVGCFQTHQPE